MPSLTWQLRWVFVVVALLAAARGDRGYAVNWDGGGRTSEWIDPANWEGDVLPATNESAAIVNHTATITGTFAPPVFAVDLGRENQPGSLRMTGAAGAATLEVVGPATIAANGELQVGPGSAHLFAAEVHNLGNVTVNADGRISASEQYVQNGGATTLAGGSIDAPIVQINDGVLSGQGTIDGNLVVGGDRKATPTLEPGAEIGSIKVEGDLHLRTGAALTIQIDASGRSPRHDQLIVSGVVSLGGTLQLDSINDLAIPSEKPLKIISAERFEPGAVFDEILGLATDDGSWSVFIDPFDDLSSVNVNVTQLLGDMNADGIVDALDADQFAWAIRDANSYREEYILSLVVEACAKGICGSVDEQMADMDFDGVRTIADIPLFLQQVEESGGAVAAAMNQIVSVLGQEAIVPEPHALELAALPLVLLVYDRFRRRATHSSS